MPAERSAGAAAAALDAAAFASAARPHAAAARPAALAPGDALDGEGVSALRRARSPGWVRRASRLLAALLAALPFGLALIPWQQHVLASGRVVALGPLDRPRAVEAPIAGRASRWWVHEGSRVAAGDPLVEITDNDPDLPQRLAEQRAAAEARVEAAEARLEAFEAQVSALIEAQSLADTAAAERVRMGSDRIDAAQRAVEGAEAAALAARLHLERQVRLVAEGLASTRARELAEVGAAQADAERERARAGVRAAEAELRSLEAERDRLHRDNEARLGAARAARDTARADLAAARSDLVEREVRLARQATQLVTAPAAGTVLSLRGGVGGEVFKAGDPVLTLVPDAQALAVELWVDGNDLPLLREGRAARLQFEGWPAVQFAGWPSVAVGTFGGRIAFVDAASDGQGRFRIVVTPDPDERPWPEGRYLRQGLRAKAWVLLDEVALGYELWRQLNGFPPAVDDPALGGGGPRGKVPGASKTGGGGAGADADEEAKP